MRLIDIYIIKCKKELSSLLNEFHEKNTGFVFRGHADSRWCLQPTAFRQKRVRSKSCSDDGPITKCEEENWFENTKTLSKLSLILPTPNQNNSITEDSDRNILNVKCYKNGIRWDLINFLKLRIQTMQINYNLCQYTTENTNYYAEEFLKKNIIQDAEHWNKFDTFLSGFYEPLSLVDRYCLYTGKILNLSPFDEHITSYDETRPQHYNIATSALDWTRDPDTALYFASPCLADNDSKKIITYQHNHIALFCYKQLLDDGNLSVKLENPPEGIENKRAKAQKGMFTLMPQARSYYLLNGCWPKIEDYDEKNGKEFILNKYIIQLNKETTDCIKDILVSKNKNKQSMRLD